MVSGHTLDIINPLLQYCKGSDMIMGDVEMNLCGDVLQLATVPNNVSDDVGDPAILYLLFFVICISSCAYNRGS